jgi:DNA topoisomerase-6 subunit A
VSTPRSDRNRDDDFIPKHSKEICLKILEDLEKARRPVLEAVKCALDNAFYNPKVGYLTPGDKTVKTELNVSSVQKMARSVFLLEILLRNIETGGVNTKRELYYIAKGECKSNPRLKALDFQDQDESDSVIDFICELLEVYREEMNCFATDRGGATYCQNLVSPRRCPTAPRLSSTWARSARRPSSPRTARRRSRSSPRRARSTSPWSSSRTARRTRSSPTASPSATT